MGAWASLPSLPGSLLNWVWCKCWSMSQGFSYYWPWCCYDTPVHPTKASLLWSIGRGECSSQTCPYFSTPNIVFSLFVLDKKVLKYFKPSPSNAQPPNWVSPLHFRSSCESCCIWYPSHPSHAKRPTFDQLPHFPKPSPTCWTGKYKIDYGTVCLPIWGSILRPLLIRFDQQSSPPLGVMLSEYAGWHMAGVTRDKGVNAAQLPLHDYNLASISPHHICSSLSCLPCLSNSYVLHWVILLSRQMLKSEY